MVVITTGGLGPTPDDMTVEAIAKIMGWGTGVDETLVKRYMESRGIEKRADVSEGLIKMATKPEGSVAHPNPARRWLPAWESQVGETTIYSLPGPPREVEALFRQSVEDALAGIYDDVRLSLRVAVNPTRIAVRPDPAQRDEPISQYLPQGLCRVEGSARPMVSGYQWISSFGARSRGGAALLDRRWRSLRLRR